MGGWLARGAVVAAAGWLVVSLVLELRETAHWVDLGRAGAPGAVRYVPEHQLFVVSRGGEALVLSAISPHIPGSGERVFYCPSGYFVAPHGELFDARGRYITGPAPRGMDRFPHRIEDGVVLADLRAVIRGPPRTALGVLPQGRQCPAPSGHTEEAAPGILP